MTPKQIYKKHENEKKRQYAERVMEIEQVTFTPLVFTTTGGMADECVRYHSRLAELIANKKGESYSSAISWIRAKVSFAIVRSAILCLRGSRSRRRQLQSRTKLLEKVFPIMSTFLRNKTISKTTPLRKEDALAPIQCCFLQKPRDQAFF